MTVNLQKANVILEKFKKMCCPYSGEILFAPANKKMTDIIPAKKSYDANILKNDPAKAEVLEKYLKKLDEIIAKNPKNVELRKYRACVEKLGGIKK